MRALQKAALVLFCLALSILCILSGAGMLIFAAVSSTENSFSSAYSL